MPNTPRTPIPIRMDSRKSYGNLRDTRLYEDAVYEKFSDAEIFISPIAERMLSVEQLQSQTIQVAVP